MQLCQLQVNINQMLNCIDHTKYLQTMNDMNIYNMLHGIQSQMMEMQNEIKLLRNERDQEVDHDGLSFSFQFIFST